MSTDTKKIMYDVGGDSSTAIKCLQELQTLATELYLLEYATQEGYELKVKPHTPASATADNMRRYDADMTEFKTEVNHLRKLREAARGYLTTAAYEQLCVRMGRSTAESLSAREIMDGMKTHYSKMPTAQAESMVKSLQVDWDTSTSLTAHVIKHGVVFADLKAGKKGQLDQVSKETLWRTLSALTRNAVYTVSLCKPMRMLVEDDTISMPKFVADFLAELDEEHFADLNADTSKAAEAVLEVKEQRDRKEKDAHFQAIRKANKERFKDTPIENTCPVHTDAKEPHLWKDCTHRTGKRLSRK